MDWFAAALALVLLVVGFLVYFVVFAVVRYFLGKASLYSSLVAVVAAVVVVVVASQLVLPPLALLSELRRSEAQRAEAEAEVARTLRHADEAEAEAARAKAEAEAARFEAKSSEAELTRTRDEAQRIQEAFEALNQRVGDLSALSTPEPLPTRIFTGPGQYPPESFAAYGIVAFPGTATKDEFKRYSMICDAYVSTLLFYKEVTAPISEQMVTAWPIDKDDEATRINRMPRDTLCKDAVGRYGLTTAQKAIKDAKNSHAKINGLGPFLLAWSPSRQKGMPDALVLVSDLSQVTTIEQAKRLFTQWGHDIEENPELWENGWNMSKVKTLIGLWADKYGERLLQLVSGKP